MVEKLEIVMFANIGMYVYQYHRLYGWKMADEKQKMYAYKKYALQRLVNIGMILFI